MSKILLILFLKVPMLNFWTPIEYAGVYSRTAGESTTRSITLMTVNCDSTLEIKFSAHMTKWTMTGNWTVNGDTLKIKMNPSKYNGEEVSWNSIDQFLIRKKKLVPVITEWNGRKIDAESLVEVNKDLRSEAYMKIEDKTCQ